MTSKCEQVREQLADFLDGFVEANGSHVAHSHLAECAQCAKWFAAHQQLTADLQELDRVANRLALTPAQPQATQRFITAWKVAAAITIAVGATLAALQWTSRPENPAVPIVKTEPHRPQSPPTPARQSTTARVELVEANGRPRWIVPVSSSDERIKVVWAYETLARRK